MGKIKSEFYKGYKLQFSKNKKGFNKYNVMISKILNKGFREEKYILEIFSTYTSKKNEALELAKKFIDENEKRFKFRSNGLSQAKYLPSIKEQDDWKSVMKNLKNDRDKMSRSDLQGVASAESLKLIEIFNIPKDKRSQVENIFLLYIDDELDINSAKRYLLELRSY